MFVDEGSRASVSLAYVIIVALWIDEVKGTATVGRVTGWTSDAMLVASQ